MTLKLCTHKKNPKIIAAAKLGRVKTIFSFWSCIFMIVTSKKYLVISHVKMFKNLYGVIVEVKQRVHPFQLSHKRIITKQKNTASVINILKIRPFRMYNPQPLTKDGLYTRTVRFFLNHSLHCKCSVQNLFPKIVVIFTFH